MRGESRAVGAFRTHGAHLIRHIDRQRKGARRPDEQKHPRLHRVVLAIALNGVRHSTTALNVRPYSFSEGDDEDG